MPPDRGIDAPSSAQTRPSHSAISAPMIQPIITCGPPMAEMISGIVMNGPIPTICAMLSEVAGNRPMARMNPRDSSGACERPRVDMVTLRVEAGLSTAHGGAE